MLSLGFTGSTLEKNCLNIATRLVQHESISELELIDLKIMNSKLNLNPQIKNILIEPIFNLIENAVSNPDMQFKIYSQKDVVTFRKAVVYLYRFGKLSEELTNRLLA